MQFLICSVVIQEAQDLISEPVVIAGTGIGCMTKIQLFVILLTSHLFTSSWECSKFNLSVIYRIFLFFQSINKNGNKGTFLTIVLKTGTRIIFLFYLIIFLNSSNFPVSLLKLISWQRKERRHGLILKPFHVFHGL